MPFVISPDVAISDRDKDILRTDYDHDCERFGFDGRYAVVSATPLHTGFEFPGADYDHRKIRSVKTGHQYALNLTDEDGTRTNYVAVDADGTIWYERVEAGSDYAPECRD